MTSKQQNLLMGIATSLFLIPQISLAEDRVIYGEDNRLDHHEVDEQTHLDYAKATAMLMTSSDLTDLGNGKMSLPTDTLQQSNRVCEEEPYSQQPNPGWCSGFLVGKDTLVTAGHCITSQSRCNSTSFVFDYKISVAGNQPDDVLKSNVYTCKKIIKQQLGGDVDFAVIQLDRVVEGITPLSFRKSGKVEDGEDLVMIGHPSGLPSKVAAGAAVRSNSNANYFVATTDSYGGNSGSAVINEATGEVEGILVRGETDFVRAPGKSCLISNVCTEEGCRGEDVSRATDFAPFVPAEITQPADEVIVESAQSISIPDNDASGAELALEVSEEGALTSLVVDLDITHTYIGDLTVVLTAPSGKQSKLHSRTGGSANDIKKSYEVTDLNGEEIKGTWTLKVVDNAGIDVGTINNVKLTIKL